MMSEITLNNRTVTLRPLTVGDLRELGPLLGGMEGMVKRDAHDPAQVATAIMPLLARMTGMTLDDLTALTLPEYVTLLRAAAEVLARPFAER